MIDKELIEKIDKKLKETKSLRNLNSRDPGFKNWHVSTINLLKMLPRQFARDVNNFKKLTFADTGYHRGNKPFSPADNTKYLQDLDNAVNILKKIASTKTEDKTKKASSEKIEGKAEKVPEIKKKNKTKKATTSTNKATTKGAAKKPRV
ncbi:MAG: hypothetical protein PHC87_05590 [Actinomycetota bacterium]|nr:hypothetical protein [Actinomycetota bacterium]